MANMNQLIEAAELVATTPRTVTREDGSTFRSAPGCGSCTEGRFQVYVVPVRQRTRAMKAHFRATFYLDGRKTSRAAFAAALAGEGVE
jgi:hypothetical protein